MTPSEERKAWRLRRRKQVEARREAGLCLTCGKGPAPCAECNEKRAERRRRAREENAR